MYTTVVTDSPSLQSIFTTNTGSDDPFFTILLFVSFLIPCLFNWASIERDSLRSNQFREKQSEIKSMKTNEPCLLEGEKN